MAVRKAKKANKAKTAAGADKLDGFDVLPAIFRCSACSRPLEVDKVISADVERIDGNATGFLCFEHFCPCDEGAVLSSRGFGSQPSLVALFGTPPLLPYRAPFSWQGVTEDDPDVTRWRWELEQVADFDDFMLFLNAA